MKYLPTDSAVLEGVRYAPLSRTLEIKFRNDRVYRYYLVSEETYRDFLKAGSLGKFFNENIRDHYLFAKVPQVEA